ncbi:MAG: hypothetical protein Q8Q36_02615 [bacterium]|nr:hypothetical protein [bacterium]
MQGKLDIEALKAKLKDEELLLERELKGLGKQVPERKGDWEATPSELNNSSADKNEAADRVEDFEGKIATESELERQLHDIKSALERLENGTYGLCEVDGKPIEPERLLANPSARTCIAHKG